MSFLEHLVKGGEKGERKNKWTLVFFFSRQNTSPFVRDNNGKDTQKKKQRKTFFFFLSPNKKKKKNKKNKGVIIC